MSPSQLGRRSSQLILAVGLAYAGVLAVGMAHHGLSEPITDPILAVMEVLTIVSALPILALFVAIHAASSPNGRLPAVLGLLFAAMFACATIGVHVVELTAGRALAHPGLVWPSVPYAIELFAWDLLLGLALLCAGSALPRTASAGRLVTGLRLTGALCVAGLVGPLVGNMRLQLVGVFGYAICLPVVAWMLAGWFSATAPNASAP